MKELPKNHLKTLNFAKFRIHTKTDRHCFYKSSRNQTFTLISSKLAYFKKHLPYQVNYSWETKFSLPLNVPYSHQVTKPATGIMTDPHHTWLFYIAVKVMGQSKA